MKYLKTLILAALLLFIFNCKKDNGLQPESLEPEPTGISGKVTFVGNWPAGTEYYVAIGVANRYPPQDLMDISAYSDPIPINTTEYDYFLELSPGTYAAVGAAWASIQDLYNPIMLGFYSTTPGAADPSPVTVEEGKTTKNINITADFSILGKLIILSQQH